MFTHLARLISQAFGCRYVLLIDSSGERTIARVKHWPDGTPYASRFAFGIRDVELGDGGRVINGCYVKRWQPIVIQLWNSVEKRWPEPAR